MAQGGNDEGYGRLVRSTLLGNGSYGLEKSFGLGRPNIIKKNNRGFRMVSSGAGKLISRFKQGFFEYGLYINIGVMNIE
jgi:hypothetical protein